MCGIAGIVRFDGAPPDRAALERMTRALAHRGPDGFGHEVLGPAALGHRRLAILDLSEAGHQPMRRGDTWLVHNGEVYNYLELRDELGGTFSSGTDTEVILEAYRRFGAGCFSRFNGMWALALWDAEERRLVLSRDRFGIKPLYLHADARRALFASEPKAILAAEPALARLDRTQVARFLGRPALAFGRQSFFEGIESVPPGSTIELDAAGRRMERRYYRFTPPRVAREVSAPEAAEEVRALLEDAVRLRFRSDVPVGTCLSGGLDSSSIVALSAKVGHAPATFSAIYEDAGFSELEYVRAMTEHLGLVNHEIRPDGRDLAEVVERATYFMDAPSGGPGIYSQWHVMRRARAEGVTVLLDGQGADEVFGGYHRYFTPYVRSLVQAGLRGEPRRIIEALRARGPIKALSGEDPFAALLGHLRRKLRPPRPAPGILTPELRTRLAELAHEAPMAKPSGDPLTDELWDALVRTSIPTLLHYEDRNSMAFGIEARTPYLDYRVVELAFSLPTPLKIRGAETKAILRDAMRPLLPERVHARRDKLGYPTPFSLWLRQGHEEWVRELLGPRFLARGFVEAWAVNAQLERHREGQDESWPLFRLLTLELFCRRFVDGPFEAEPSPSYAGLSRMSAS